MVTSIHNLSYIAYLGQNLYIAGTLSKPVLTYDKQLFVGERIQFSCYSRYKGTPSNLSQNIGYKYNYNYRHSMDSFLDIAHSDKGKNVSCQASNEIGELSPISNVITLDPYCEYTHLIYYKILAVVVHFHI